MFDDFWDGLEAQCTAAGLMMSMVPACMKKLLTITGYNSAWSFKSISEEKLAEAEDFIEKYHRKEADEFDEYKTMKPFKFLPGHKSLIFGIKSEIDEFPKNKKPKNNKKSDPVLSERDLQTALLIQMSAFTKGLGLKIDWSNSIEESSYTATESASFCTCTVSCPVCSSTFVIRYDKHWKNSNLCKHVRKHKPSVQSELDTTAAVCKNTGKIIDWSKKHHVIRKVTIAAIPQTYEEYVVTDDNHLDGEASGEDYMISEINDSV